MPDASCCCEQGALEEATGPCQPGRSQRISGVTMGTALPETAASVSHCSSGTREKRRLKDISLSGR